ncbi:MAG: hypothetical protein Q4G00_09750 [Clostridia bacterium]|nr:hypothetical protein [Clostridia bacterium]
MAKEKHTVLKYTRVKPATNVAISLLFIFLAFICLMPALLVLIVSFSSEASIRMKGYSYFPNALSMASYEYLARQTGYIGRAFLNSIGITIVGTVLGLITTSTMGFALSRPNYRLRKFSRSNSSFHNPARSTTSGIMSSSRRHASRIS